MCDMARLQQLRQQALALTKEIEAYIASEKAKEGATEAGYPAPRSTRSRIA